jgi:hypothetical protein
VKGRAYKLLNDFRERHAAGLSGTFLMSRFILLSKIVPERITPELDDPAIEARIEAAIAKVSEPRPK